MESKIEIANNISFENVCNLLEQLTRKKLRVQDKEKILDKYILDFKCNVAKDQTENKSTSFYPILRLLVPSYERERGPYNLKEHKLGDLLVKVLSLDKKSSDAMKLLQPCLNAQDGDFGNVAYHVLRSRVSQNTCNLTIGAINDTLDRIANVEVGNKRVILDDIFSKTIGNLTPAQTKWFLRMVLKDLKVGLSSKRILSCYHPDAPEHYERFGNLAKVCEELEDGNFRPTEVGIELNYAVSPMLSERLDVTDIGSLNNDKTYQIEEKFDGERFQIHMEKPTLESNDPVFKYFSRKGFDFSDKFGRSYDSGLLTPHFKHRFSSQITSFVLDGEMMGWHKERQWFGSKGMAFDVKKLTENSRFQPCFVAFDVLYFNGRSLVGPEESGGMKLKERVKLLDTMFLDVPGSLQHSARTSVTQKSDILNALNNAIDNQDEGIVVKDVDSYYMANKRNAGWYKIKPEYTEGVIDDMDLVIIGIDAAENARRGKAKSFVVAVADAQPGEPPHRWLCAGRVATGLSDEQRSSVCALLEKRWRPFRQHAPPPALVFNRVKPDYWILPEHSVVVQVRATELIRSTDFGTDYTLRFPRIKRVRDDKPVKDTMTLQEFNDLVQGAGAVFKLGNKRVGEELIGDAEAKPRKKRVSILPQVPDDLKKTTVGDVEVTSQALKGRKIFILSDDEDCKKEQLIRIVESHGGKVVANPGSDTWVSIVGRSTYRARSFISAGEHDVAPTAWLRDLPLSSAPISLAPLDFITMKRETRLAYAREYDTFGDNYTKPATEDSLRRCFKKMDDEPQVYLTKQEMLNLDRELFGDNNPLSFLRSCSLHIAAGRDSVLGFHSQMLGATLCDIDDINLTHAVVSKDIEPKILQGLREQLWNRKVPVVSEEWLEKCFAHEKLVSETIFAM